MAPSTKERCDRRVGLCRRLVGSDRHGNSEVIGQEPLMLRHRRVAQVGSHCKRRLGIRQWAACRLGKTTTGTKGATSAQVAKLVAQRLLLDEEVRALMGSEVTIVPRNTRDEDGGANATAAANTLFEDGSARPSMGGETVERRNLIEDNRTALVGKMLADRESMDGKASIVSSCVQLEGVANMSNPVSMRSPDIRDTCVEFLNKDDRAAAAAAGVLLRLCNRHNGDADIGRLPTDVRAANTPNTHAGDESSAPGDSDETSTGRHARVPFDCVEFLKMEDRAAAAAAGLLSRLQAKTGADQLHLDMCGSIPVRKKATIALDAVEPSGVARSDEGRTNAPTQLSARNPRLRDENADFFEMEERAAAAAAGLLLRLQSGRTKDSRAKALTTSCRGSRVKFDLKANTVHAVTPYAEIYGRHPRRFVFDKDSTMIPSAHGGFVSLRSLTSSDDKEEETDEEESDGEQTTLSENLIAEANESKGESVI